MAGKWLFKSDPEAYSFEDLVRDKRTVWDGVSNNLALKHLRGVRKGDQVMIYHSGKERSICGLAEALSDSYADPDKRNPRLAVVDIAAVWKFPKSVTLGEIKKHSALKDFDLARLPRLSVMPMSDRQWKTILAMVEN